MDDSYRKLSSTDPTERVLLLSHCLRPSESCPGKYTKQGLICPDSCEETCVVGRLTRTALSLGYKGVCTAAGGRMAIRFVAENQPRGIVAVACFKELEEGVEAVQAMANEGQEVPAILVVPLSKDGCIDTEVNEEEAMSAIQAGCGVTAAS